LDAETRFDRAVSATGEGTDGEEGGEEEGARRRGVGRQARAEAALAPCLSSFSSEGASEGASGHFAVEAFSLKEGPLGSNASSLSGASRNFNPDSNQAVTAIVPQPILPFPTSLPLSQSLISLFTLHFLARPYHPFLPASTHSTKSQTPLTICRRISSSRP
jgi:hypothetical protein